MAYSSVTALLIFALITGSTVALSPEVSPAPAPKKSHESVPPKSAAPVVAMPPPSPSTTESPTISPTAVPESSSPSSIAGGPSFVGAPGPATSAAILNRLTVSGSGVALLLAATLLL